MLAIYGGTFDPVHFGHLRTALDVAEQVELEKVLMVPARVPPHREMPDVDAADRRDMLALALQGQHRLLLDERELHRDGPSYTVDTLQSYRDELGDTPLGLIIGQDAFLGLEQWHQWERLTTLAHLLVMTRPGLELPQTGVLADLLDKGRVRDAAALKTVPAGRIFLCEVTQLAISATDIRQRLQEGRSIRYLLPEEVNEYILSKNLYS